MHIQPPIAPHKTMHANATLTPLRFAQMIAALSRPTLCCALSPAGLSMYEKTARRWRDRAQVLGSPARLPDRSSAPHRYPIHTSAGVDGQIVALGRMRRVYTQI